jgi:hypothetical protein
MKRVLLLLGAIALVGLLACLSGCILHTRTLTIVVTDLVCSEFREDHDDENYMDETETVDDDFFEQLDVILADNDLSKDDIESVDVTGAYYKVKTGAANGPWTVSGRIWVQVDGGALVEICSYQSVVLTGPMAEAERIETNEAGLDVLVAALEQYLATDNPGMYPTITFYADREVGDISPSPTEMIPFVCTWDGCLSMEVNFTEEYDVYDLFPSD